MSDNPEASVVPTQADRAAAKEVFMHINRKGVVNTPEDAERIYGMFARHRLAHQTSPATQPIATVGEVEHLRPNFGFETDEPSLGEMVLDYYRRHFPIGEAFNLRDKYFATLHTPPPVATATVVDAGCTVPPAGWRCTRTAGHSGPCAAVPTDAPPTVEDAWRAGFGAAEEVLGAHGSEWLLGAIESAWTEYAADHALAATPAPTAGGQ